MTKNNDTALLPVNVQAVQDRVKQLMKDIGFPDSTTVYTAFMQLANEFSQGCFTDRPTAPQNAPERTLESHYREALEEIAKGDKTENPEQIAKTALYSTPFEVFSKELAPPQNAEALEALEYMTRYPALAEKFKDLKKFDHAVETIRNALQSPARPVVKPLVWVDYEDDGMKRCVLSIAKCIFGQYQIRRDSQGRLWPEGTKMLNETFRNTIDEAKAAAEAHWQAKIGECLV